MKYILRGRCRPLKARCLWEAVNIYLLNIEIQSVTIRLCLRLGTAKKVLSPVGELHTFDRLVLFVNIDLSAAVLAVGPSNCSHLAATVQKGVGGCQWLSSHCSHL